MKTSLLVVTDESLKDLFPSSAYDVTFVSHLSMVPKLTKKQSFELCFVQMKKYRREDWALLKQIVRLGPTWDLLLAVERTAVEKALELVDERGDHLIKPYSPKELQAKLIKLAAKRTLEKENRFWRVELATLLADRETLSRSDIPADIWDRAKESKGREDEASFRRSRKEFEKQCIRQALERAHGNQTQAAKALGIHRNTLLWKMKKLHLS